MQRARNRATAWLAPDVAPLAASLGLVLGLAGFALSCGDAKETGDSAGADTAGVVPVWTQAYDTSGGGSLSGVWGAAPDDVWIVGGDENSGEAWHFDGSSWSAGTLPADTPLLVWVHGRSAGDVFAVGLDGAAIHWDGAAWTALDSGTDEDLWGVFAADGGEVWVVGGDADVGDPLILRSLDDGGTFVAEALAGDQNPRGATTLFKVWGIEDQLWIVGQSGTLLERQGDAWNFVSAGAEANQDFVSLHGTGPDHVIIAGGRGNARVGQYDGAAWTTLAPSGVGGLNAVAVLPDGTAVMGGIGGYVGLFDPGTGTLSHEGTLGSGAIHAAWDDGAGRTWVVGGNFAVPHEGLAFSRTLEPSR
jgi:trimeric autotransporter adhesin